MAAARIVIVSPALADANNGNWQTARRWQLLLRPLDARIVRQWPDAQASDADQLMLALHALRSADSIRAWAERTGLRAAAPNLVVVLTGTDLYGDIGQGSAAMQSLHRAARLVVLQARGLDALPVELRTKTRVILQSSTARKTLTKTAQRVRAVMVGHLRAVKDPQTLWAAARLLAADDGLRVDHIGQALEPALGDQARATQAVAPHFRWLGGQPHEAVRRRIQRAHVLVHSSRIEGGAHVIMEALRSGTSVLASRIDGNVGMLGEDYAGYFEAGDAAALAALLQRFARGLRRAAGTPQDPDAQWVALLTRQCAERAALFAPQAERAALLALIHELLPPSICAGQNQASAPPQNRH